MVTKRTAETPVASTVPEPHGKPGGGLWEHPGLMAPPYIEHVAGRLIEQGHDESEAYHMAVGIVQNWAAGHDGHGNAVHPDVQAAAAKNIAQWEALKARYGGGKSSGRSAGMAHTEFRDQMATSDINDLPDSAFAYIEPGGTKDGSGKTVPRSLRHFPIHDKAHADNAAARIAQGAKFGKEALPKVKAAQKKFGESSDDSDDGGRGQPGRAVERRWTTSMVGVVLLGGEESRDGGPRRIGGYAAKFNSYSRDLGEFVEQVHPAFFNRSKGNGWPGVICRFNHDTSQLLGTIAGRTLGLNVDRDGLLYEVEPPRAMQHVVDYVERGDVSKSSFAFRCIEDEWSITSDGGPLRTLHSGQLVDVSPVVDPAYPDSTAGLRSFAEHFDADFEEVRSMAAAKDLRRFFVRTDRSSVQPAKPKIPATVAMMQLMERRRDPFADQG